MRLLALDQASRTSGWAVFEDDILIDSGTFTLKSDDIGERLVDYRKHIEKLICDNDIEEVAFEDI
jgi:Holliday junction resolvasome RuvABC endonuclease subunit